MRARARFDVMGTLFSSFSHLMGLHPIFAQNYGAIWFHGLDHVAGAVYRLPPHSTWLEFCSSEILRTLEPGQSDIQAIHRSSLGVRNMYGQFPWVCLLSFFSDQGIFAGQKSWLPGCTHCRRRPGNQCFQAARRGARTALSKFTKYICRCRKNRASLKCADRRQSK
jgi:hypothetical protein